VISFIFASLVFAGMSAAAMECDPGFAAFKNSVYPKVRKEKTARDAMVARMFWRRPLRQRIVKPVMNIC
jgi:hypothetical protein